MLSSVNFILRKHGSTHHVFASTMSRAAKATLIASILASSLTVWGVHYLQQQEHEVRMPSPDPPVDYGLC
jgi:hypothetical protein